MSVDIRVVGAGIQWGVPQRLFGTNNPNLQGSSHYSPAGSYHRYAVSSDGQRFLVPQPAAAAPTSRGAPTRGGTLADALVAAVDLGRGLRGRGAAAVEANEIAVVLDWPRLLKPQ